MEIVETEIAKIAAKEIQEVKRHNLKSTKLQKTIRYYQQQMKFHADNLTVLESTHEQSLELLAAQKQRWMDLKQKAKK